MASTEAPISITVKTAAGSLVTVRAEDAHELDNIVATSLDALRSAVIELEGVVRNGAPAAPQMTTEAIAASLGARIISEDIGAPSIGGRNCPHGRMTPIQGMGKDGKPYKGYFCPAPKGAFDKCKNQYINIQSPDWNTFVPEQVK